jgi:hypothetical protein
MRLPRRSFLKSGTLAALSAGVALTSAKLAFGQKRRLVDWGQGFPIPNEAWKDRLLTYTHQSFEPYIGSIFTTSGPWRRTIELKLISVTPYAPRKVTRITTGKPPGTECSSLMFNANAPLPKVSTIITLNHAALGKLDLFLKESRGQRGEMLCEAVINHIR